MFKIIEESANQSSEQSRNRTLLYEDVTNKYYVVSSVDHPFLKETMVFESDSSGVIDDYTEVLVCHPNRHEEVVKYLILSNIQLSKERVIDFENFVA